MKPGSDSILTGIDIMKRYILRVTKRSVNLIRELKNYKWKEDSSGKPLNVPVDRFNHGIDTIRYACMGMLFIGKPDCQNCQTFPLILLSGL
jgi:phage terminase large subunit